MGFRCIEIKEIVHYLFITRTKLTLYRFRGVEL